MLWVNAELTEHHAWCFWLNWPLQCFAWPAPAVSSTAFPWSDAHFSDYLWAAPAGSSSSALSLDISSARTLLFSGRLSPWWVHWLPQLYHFYPDDSQICNLGYSINTNFAHLDEDCRLSNRCLASILACFDLLTHQSEWFFPKCKLDYGIGREVRGHRQRSLQDILRCLKLILKAMVSHWRTVDSVTMI